MGVHRPPFPEAVTYSQPPPSARHPVREVAAHHRNHVGIWPGLAVAFGGRPLMFSRTYLVEHCLSGRTPFACRVRRSLSPGPPQRRSDGGDGRKRRRIAKGQRDAPRSHSRRYPHLRLKSVKQLQRVIQNLATFVIRGRRSPVLNPSLLLQVGRSSKSRRPPSSGGNALRKSSGSGRRWRTGFERHPDERDGLAWPVVSQSLRVFAGERTAVGITLFRAYQPSTACERPLHRRSVPAVGR